MKICLIRRVKWYHAERKAMVHGLKIKVGGQWQDLGGDTGPYIFESDEDCIAASEIIMTEGLDKWLNLHRQNRCRIVG